MQLRAGEKSLCDYLQERLRKEGGGDSEGEKRAWRPVRVKARDSVCSWRTPCLSSPFSIVKNSFR